MRKQLCFLIIFLPIISLSQPIEIKGNAKFFKNEKLQVYYFTNHITNTKKLLSETIIPDNGVYKLTFNISKPMEIIVKIEMREILLHLHPGTNLTLDFTPIKFATNQRIPLKFNLSYTTIPINIAPDSIYQIIKSDFAFIQQSITPITKLSTLYDSFFEIQDSVYAHYITNDNLFNAFYTYFKAHTYLQTRVSKSQLIKKHISKKPIIYDNSEYLYFFKYIMNSHIHNYIIKNELTFNETKKEYKIYDALINFLSNDSLLQNLEIRSLAIYTFASSKSSNNHLNLELRNAIINQINNFCIYPEQRLAAKNHQQKTNLLTTNTEAPIFALENASAELISLQSYRGMPVYLGFIHSKSITCQKDLLLIEALQKKYRKVQFLMIISDRDSVLTSQIPKESNNLHFLFLNKNYTILEQYQIWNYPIYYLIDKHGYFLQLPSKRPNQMFDVFEKMFRKKSKRKSYEIINN